jgi:hypothetical protein
MSDPDLPKIKKAPDDSLSDLGVVPVPVLKSGDSEDHVGAGRLKLCRQREVDCLPGRHHLRVGLEINCN